MVAKNRELALGVIGCGHWGPNHIRVFSELDGTNVVACADLNPSKLENIKLRFPNIEVTTNFQHLLANESIDAVVIATPTNTHAGLARQVLAAGKHVLVEKPLCPDSADGIELAQLAAASNLVLMVGHVFLFNSGIIKLREMILNGELGSVHYLDAVRTNLGPVRGDVNALYDLGTHDITIFNYLMDALPVAVSALGRCVCQETIEDVCFATLTYPDGTLGHIHVSWMNPRKVRTLTVIGDRRMAHWDDVDPTDTLRLYDKGIEEPPNYNSLGEFHFALRNADVYLPAIRRTEPLVGQAKAFVSWIKTGNVAGPTALDGCNIARILEAATQSMQQGGRMVEIQAVEPQLISLATASKSLVGAPGNTATEHLHPDGTSKVSL